ncbi:MAG: PilZ domain-containing protein [Candidatus Cryosericum sp.]
MAMTYGGQGQVGQFFTAVAHGFVETRFEIILFFLIVVAFLAVMIVLFVRQKRQADRDFAGRARRLASRHRRIYLRRRVRLPVLVAQEPDAADARQTILLDLGGGGASLRNPWELMRRGASLRMSFSPGAGRLTVAAHIVRVSENGTAIHVEFESLSETARDQILAFLCGGRFAADSGKVPGDRDDGDGAVRGGCSDLPVGL